MTPKISVIMSCYNSESTIAASIESILNQTYKDFEFIIWNDGSTDNTETIIRSFSDDRIRYFYHENTGLGMALRLACEQARGEYIARMDSDDIALPARLDKEINYFAGHPQCVLVSSAVNYISDDDEVIGRSFPYTDSVILKRLLLKGLNVFVHPATMFRRDAYVKAGGYQPLKKAQDIHLFARIARQGEVYVLPDILLNYRISVNSISTQTDNNVYTPIIRTFLNKMVRDDSINTEDIELYNQIVALSKKCKKDISAVNEQRRKESFEVRLYNAICKSFGNKNAEQFVYATKNLIGRIKYRK